MSLRLSKPNTRAFLSYVPGAPPVFAKDPEAFLSFAPVSQPSASGRTQQTVLEVAAIGAEPHPGNLFLSLDTDGLLDLADEPFAFSSAKLGSSAAFQLGSETVIAVDNSEWMQSRSKSIFPTVLVLLLILLGAVFLSYLGKNSPLDASYLFYRE